MEVYTLKDGTQFHYPWSPVLPFSQANAFSNAAFNWLAPNGDGPHVGWGENFVIHQLTYDKLSDSEVPAFLAAH